MGPTTAARLSGGAGGSTNRRQHGRRGAIRQRMAPELASIAVTRRRASPADLFRPYPFDDRQMSRALHAGSLVLLYAPKEADS